MVEHLFKLVRRAENVTIGVEKASKDPTDVAGNGASVG
jgi:hypothetical protein